MLDPADSGTENTPTQSELSLLLLSIFIEIPVITGRAMMIMMIMMMVFERE